MSKARAGRKAKTGFRFRKDISVGSIVAETDMEAIRDAFQDTGELGLLRDTSRQQSVIVGRTGTGKSALILKLEQCEPKRVIRLRPASLSLRYVANSTVLRKLLAMGVKLDPFYEQLWRHVLFAELVRAHFRLDEGNIARTIWDRLAANVLPTKKSERKRRAIDYFAQWSPVFWQETDTLVRGITEKFEEKITAGAGLEIPVALSAKGELGHSMEVSEEQRERAQRIVNEISLQHVDTAVQIVREDVLTDSQKRYYILIDDLDRNWVELDFAYDLIEALFAAVEEFAALPNVKVVVALRQNILDALHADRGRQRQQREKHRNLILHLRWTDEALVELLDRRLDKFVKQYYGGTITLETLLPDAPKQSAVTGVKYALSRTFARPRDLIEFVNKCFEKASEQGSRQISWGILEAAERDYSNTRLESLIDEWRDSHGGLATVLQALRGLTPRFTLAELDPTLLEDILAAGFEESTKDQPDRTSLPLLASGLMDRGADHVEIWRAFVSVLYKIGALGIKSDPQSPVRYAFRDTIGASPPEVTPDTALFIHPALYNALQIKGLERGTI